MLFRPSFRAVGLVQDGCAARATTTVAGVAHTSMAITIGLPDRGVQLAGKVDVGEPPSRILFRQHSSGLPAGTPGEVLPSIAQAAALVSGHSRGPDTILLTDHRIVVIVCSDYSRMKAVSSMLLRSPLIRITEVIDGNTQQSVGDDAVLRLPGYLHQLCTYQCHCTGIDGSDSRGWIEPGHTLRVCFDHYRLCPGASVRVPCIST